MWILYFLLVITAVLYYNGQFRKVYLASKIRGPSLWDLLTVHAEELLNNRMLSYMCKMCADFSYRPWGMWLMTGDYVIVISDPNTFEELYKSKHLQNKSDHIYGTLSDYAGGGLLVLNGERWRLHRKMAQPAFRKSLLESNINIVFERVDNLMQELREKADGPAFDFGEIIDEKLFDLQIRFFSNNNVVFPSTREFTEAHAHAFSFAMLKMINPLRHWFLVNFHEETRKFEKRARNLIVEKKSVFLEELERLDNLLADDDTPNDPFECMVINTRDSDIDKQELYEECLQTIVAASEPTATAIKGAVLMLALHQQAQQRVYDESEALLGKSRQPTLKDFNRMEYLGMVIKESLRLFPPGCLLLRNADEEVELSGSTIPKGTTVMLNIMALHRNPDYFKDPLEFIPERFLPEQSESRHPYSYLPFSSGTRSCIGQVHGLNVIKALLCALVRSYRILPTKGLKRVTDVKISARGTLHFNECDVQLISRDKLCS